MLNMRLLSRTESNQANSYIFLFDKPGTALHPAGQVNLQRVFERLSQGNQIVYTTHSVFMVNHVPRGIGSFQKILTEREWIKSRISEIGGPFEIL
jgi:predicted ATP-dependent endonuclease of OLD family